MDAVLKHVPALKSQLNGHTSDIVRSGKILGIGPNGQVEELLLRGNLCAGKILYRMFFDVLKKNSKCVLERLASDCRQLSGLSHPNVAVFFGLHIFDSKSIHDSSESLVLIREYANDTLTHLLERNPILPLSVKTSILLDITKALDYLHLSKPAIVHGNLTSTNVLITDSMQAKVADMECSCFYQSTRSKNFAFIAPEAAESKFETGSDMFSFGNIALHSTIHMLPEDLVQGSTEIEKRSKYMIHLKDGNKVLSNLIESCLQDAPEKRPTASAAMSDLRQLEEKPVSKGDKYHGLRRRMTASEMAMKVIEDKQEVCSESVPDQNGKVQLQVNVAQIKGGVPNVLFLYEVVTSIGVRGIKKQQKWIEYKFQISSTGFLHYSKLNGQVLKKVSLKEVTYITAHRKLGEVDVYPFYVRFQLNDCWILGAHSEDMRKSWMEAILPGSTFNQWCDCLTKSHQPLKRSSTSPVPLRTPKNDSAYIKYNEINVPGGPPHRPPPVPDRPAETIEATDSTYLTILPSSPVKDKRTEAIASYTVEQIHLMIRMFEQNVQTQPISPEKRSERKRTCSEPSEGVVLRHNPVSVSERSSKHPSKGLYLSFAEISEDMMVSTTTSSKKPTEESKPAESATIISKELKQEKQSSGATKLSRQNAVRHLFVKSPITDVVGDETTSESTSTALQTNQLRTILRQQSTEELLDSIEKPEWSRAQLEDINIKGSTKNQVQDCFTKTGNEHIISPKDLQDFSSISIGHYGAVYRAALVENASTSKGMIVTVKPMQKQSEKEWTSLLQTFSILKKKSNHPNVANLLGVVPDNNWIIMEYTVLGDLRRYLTCHNLSQSRLIKYMCDIAMGMHHIKALGLVHRNLALRNVLIMEDHTCKVADLVMKNTSFSVTKFDVGHVVYPQLDQRRWMSPENLHRGIFSEASDVWSFGVVQWEMFQPMRVPYSTLSSSQFPQHINSGHTLDIPDICHNIVAKIMRACWNWNPSKRPSFMYIASLLMQRTLDDRD